MKLMIAKLRVLYSSFPDAPLCATLGSHSAFAAARRRGMST
jgi:hypothetical protein